MPSSALLCKGFLEPDEDMDEPGIADVAVLPSDPTCRT